MNITDFDKKKKSAEKITMITCYDYTSARMLAESSVDCFLVGDSVAMTMHGFKDTVNATMEMMCLHTAAVARGAGDKFIVSDMPFVSYRKSLSLSVTAASQLIQAGAHAVKLEGAAGNEKLIRHLTDSGIPVMGHIGLTPQFVNTLGGYRVQGRSEESAARLKADALRLQAAGCFAIVLECVPVPLAKEITASLIIPTIGIGAGAVTDGQVLVYQDLLGLNPAFAPKFVKRYSEGYAFLQQGIETYVKEVQSGEFPSHEYAFEA